MCDETISAIGDFVSQTASDAGSAVASGAASVGTAASDLASSVGDLFSPSAASGGGVVGADAAVAAPTAVTAAAPEAAASAVPEAAASAVPIASPAAVAASPAVSAPVASLAPVGGVSSPSGAAETAANAIGAEAGGGAATQLDASGSFGPASTAEGALNAPATGEPGAGTGFGSDKVPGQALEGKPTPGGESPGFFSKGGGLDSALNSPITRLAAAIAPAAGALIQGQPSVPSAAAPLLPGGSVTGPLIGAEKQLLEQGLGQQVPKAVQALGASGAVTSPLIATETSQLAAANAGQLTPSQQASIDEFKQRQQSQLFQQLANSGVADPSRDSRYLQGLAEIDRQAEGMKAQLIQQAFATGQGAGQAAASNLEATQNFINQTVNQAFAAAGGAAGPLGTAANQQVQSDADFQNALAKALQSFGLIEGLVPSQKAAA